MNGPPDALTGPALPRWGFVAAMGLVAVVAALNFLRDLDQPSLPAWDENYYLTSTQRYVEGRAQFASHPPLGLMLIAAGNALQGSNRLIDTATMGRSKDIRGEALPAGFDMSGVRIASGVFAVAGAVLFFLLLLELSRRLIVSLLLANLYVFDNAFIAHFRAAHLDAFQLAFAIAALLCFVIGTRRDRDDAFWTDFGLGVFCGLAMMVKLNAAVLLLLAAMLILRRWRRDWYAEPPTLRLFFAGRDGLIMAAGCTIAIVAVFSVHVAVSPKPPDSRGPAGQKDDKFISATYRGYLATGQSLSPSVVVAAASDYLRFIQSDFNGMTRNDRNGSTPLQWVTGRRTINYRWDFDGRRTAYVQLVANPVGWGMALIATVATAWLLVLHRLRPLVSMQWASTQQHRRELMVMLLLLYVALMLVHSYLGGRRVLYLYHYFLALLPAFCLVPLVLEEAAERWRIFRRCELPLLAGTTTALLASFVFYAPLTFHRPLTRAQCEMRNALQTVVVCQPQRRPPVAAHPGAPSPALPRSAGEGVERREG